jgi:hypothetical protein
VAHLAVLANGHAIFVEHADDIWIVDHVRDVERAVTAPDDNGSLVPLGATLVLPLRHGTY